MSKLLGEFLQEHQEPFALEDFLVERGYKRSSSKKRQHHAVIPNCSAILKAVFSQFAVAKKDPKVGRTALHLKGQENEDMKRERGSSEEGGKQLSPISVLNASNDDHQDSLPHHSTSTKLIRLKPNVGSSGNYDQYSINKRALQQRQQLLIDCVREVIGSGVGMRERERGGERERGEEVWRVVCENVWRWSQDSINGSNITHLLHYHFLATNHQWNADFEHQKMEICTQIQNYILEDVINEIVTF